MDLLRPFMLLVSAAAATLALGQSGTQDWFPFVIPWDDAAKGTATDVSFLSPMPAGSNGRIIVKDGKFVEAKTGARVRFLATNITAGMCFPDKPDADKVAAHLAKMGVNLVRFHHVPSGWDSRNLWKAGKLYIEIDPVQLDKLDYFLAALKKNGIYWNINLQTSREHLPELGLPESIKQVPFSFQKRIDKFYPRLIELQEEYAKNLIGRMNPYTGLKYAEDPALMTVEINNENSLVGSPWEGFGRGLTSLPEPFRGELAKRWNGWLGRKYRNDEALRKAWSGGSGPLKPNLLSAKNTWTHENQSNGDVDVAVQPASGNLPPALTVEVRSNPGPDWHVQSHLTGLNLKEGQSYTVKFRAKADKSRNIGVSVGLDQPDWRKVGLSDYVPLTPDWKSYKFVFTAQGTEPNHARIAFTLGETTGRVWISDVAIQPGVEGGGLPQGQTLTKRNVAMPDGGTKATMDDWLDFLADLERAYSMEMRNFLVKGLGLKTNIIDSQISWGGTTGLYREKDMEFADNHAYYQHPSFFNGDWNPKDWRIVNVPMSDDMSPGAGVLGGLAAYRVAGKPYTISEYNHCAPLDAQAEQMPLAMSFAAFQDWDAIYTFDYGLTISGQPNDAIQGWFAHGTNPAKMAFFPTTALLFRQGLLPTATLTRILEVGPHAWHQTDNLFTAWANTGGSPNLLEMAVAVQLGAKTLQREVGVKSKSPLAAKDRVFTADSPKAKVISGRVAGRKVGLEGAEFDFGPIGSGFAALVLVPRDGKTVAESGSMLMSLASRVENQGMGWNAERTSVGDQWGTGPTICEPVPCQVRLMARATKVWTLDGSGRRVKSLPADTKDGWLTFQIDGSARSLWFEIGN